MKEVDNERSFRFKYFSIQMKKVGKISIKLPGSLFFTRNFKIYLFRIKMEFKIHSSDKHVS